MIIRAIYPLAVLELGRGHVSNSSHRLQWRLVEERWFPVDHLDNHDAKGPDVDLTNTDNLV